MARYRRVPDLEAITAGLAEAGIEVDPAELTQKQLNNLLRSREQWQGPPSSGISQYWNTAERIAQEQAR